jgi:hypothetical protein
VLVRVRPGAPVQLGRFIGGLSSIALQLLAAEFVRQIDAPDKMAGTSTKYRDIVNHCVEVIHCCVLRASLPLPSGRSGSGAVRFPAI